MLKFPVYVLCDIRRGRDRKAKNRKEVRGESDGRGLSVSGAQAVEQVVP